MYKINIFESINGCWVYSFATRNYGQFENTPKIMYDLNFPLAMAIKALLTKHEIYGYIYGPEYCGNCRKMGTDDGISVTFCTSCTKYICLGSLEEYSCLCNTRMVSIQRQIDEQNKYFSEEGIWALGCLEPNCIFKTYLKNRFDKNVSINQGFSKLKDEYNKSTETLIDSPSDSLLICSPYEESLFLSEDESFESENDFKTRLAIESENDFKPRLAIIHPDDLQAQPKTYINNYDEEIRSSDSTEDLNIVSSTEKSKQKVKQVDIYDLTLNDSYDSDEIEGENIVYQPRHKSKL